MLKKIILTVILIIGILVVYIIVGYGPAVKKFLTMQTVPLDNNLAAFIGYGSNSIVLISPDKSEALVVDTKMFNGAKALKTYMGEHAPNASVTIVNTHFHGDHTFGNKLFENARIIAGNYSAEEWQKETGMPKRPDVQIPVGEDYFFTIGEDTVIAHNLGRGHTWNDVVVYLKNRKILLTGDLVFNEWHPALLPDDGTQIKGWQTCLDTLMQKYDPEIVIPGHGVMGDKSILPKMHAYFSSIENSLGEKARMAEVEQQYADYFKIPGGSNFWKTVKVIENEYRGE